MKNIQLDVECTKCKSNIKLPIRGRSKRYLLDVVKQNKITYKCPDCGELLVNKGRFK
jgi:ribosomal protein L44E